MWHCLIDHWQNIPPRVTRGRQTNRNASFRVAGVDFSDSWGFLKAARKEAITPQALQLHPVFHLGSAQEYHCKTVCHRPGFLGNRLWDRDLHVGSLLRRALRIYTREGMRETGWGRERTWTVMRLHPRPIWPHGEFWSWDDPLELSAIERRGQSLCSPTLTSLWIWAAPGNGTWSRVRQVSSAEGNPQGGIQRPAARCQQSPQQRERALQWDICAVHHSTHHSLHPLCCSHPLASQSKLGAQLL